MRYGLVLEGGAMRGLFTVGVLDVLMENNIKFDAITGVSAGAAFGCNYKSEQKGRAIRYNLRFCRDKRYCSVESLIRTGDMFGAEFCYHTIPDKLDIFDRDAFKNNPAEFYAVCTDVETGRAVYHKFNHMDYTELEWIRASASMPLAARIVNINGRKLLDGGVSDSIPLEFMEKNVCDKNIVILTQPRGYVKKKSRSLSMIKSIYRKYPNFIKTCTIRHNVYNHELAYVDNSEKNGRSLVIAPPEKLPIGHIEHNHEVLLEVYRIGRNTANDMLSDIKNFMK